MNTKPLPYANSSADPFKAQQRIRDLLIKFGVDRIAFDEDFLNFEVSVRFIYRDFPVCLPVNYGRLVQLYLEHELKTRKRRRKSIEDIKQDKRKIAYRAAFSLLEDFLKVSSPW